MKDMKLVDLFEQKIFKIVLGILVLCGISIYLVVSYYNYTGIFARDYQLNTAAFSIKFPGKPKIVSNNISSGIDTAYNLEDYMTMYAYQDPSNDFVGGLNEFDVTVEQIQDKTSADSQTIADYYFNAINVHLNQNFIFKSTLSSYPETVVSKRWVNESGIPYFEYEVHLKVNAINMQEIERYYLISSSLARPTKNNISYIICIKGGSENGQPTEFNSFANTFRLNRP